MSALLPPFPSAVIFDWDNTLIDNWGAITEALNKVRALHGLETWTVPEARIKSSRALRDSFPEWFGDKWEEMRDIFYTHFNSVHIERLTVMDGAPDLLEWLREHKIPLFIVSTKNNTLLNAEVDHLGWRSIFVSIMGSLDTPKDKPNRMPVDIALGRGGLQGDNPSVWFIGDAQSDVECALNSGCMPVMIHNIEYGKKIGVKLNFSDCFALKTALNKWNWNNSAQESIACLNPTILSKTPC